MSKCAGGRGKKEETPESRGSLNPGGCLCEEQKRRWGRHLSGKGVPFPSPWLEKCNMGQRPPASDGPFLSQGSA